MRGIDRDRESGGKERKTEKERVGEGEKDR